MSSRAPEAKPLAFKALILCFEAEDKIRILLGLLTDDTLVQQMTNISNLTPYAKTAETIYAFLSGGIYIETLDTIGGVHIEAAKREAQKLNSSANKREGINRMLIHLDTVHVAFKKSWQAPIFSHFREVKAEVIAAKDIKICCLIAMCHKLLGDNHTIIKGSIDDACEAFDFLRIDNKNNAQNMFSVLNMANPITIIDMIRYEGVYPSRRRIKEDLAQFIDTIYENEVNTIDFLETLL